MAIAIAGALLGGCGSSPGHSGSSATASSASTAISPAAGPPCGPSGATTLAASRSARVYASGGQVSGCAAGSPRAYALGRRASCLGAVRIAPVALSGTLAAYGAQSCGVDTGRSQVVVRQLRDGKVLADQPATTSRVGVESYVRVSALVLARDGAVAWISVAGSVIGHRRLIEVHALDRKGRRRLDAGRGIATGVLALNGVTVRWRDEGRWRSAQLR